VNDHIAFSVKEFFWAAGAKYQYLHHRQGTPRFVLVLVVVYSLGFAEGSVWWKEALRMP